MADVILSKPASGQTTRIACEPDSRFVIDFHSEESVVSVQDGDLVFSFPDDSRVSLQDFTRTYTTDSMPNFLFLKYGVEVDGRDFWEAFNAEELNPEHGWLQFASASEAPLSSAPLPDAVTDMVQPDDPSLVTDMIMLQTTGA